MHNILIDGSTHEWEKQNLVTLDDKKGQYDQLMCKNCGMKGRRYNFREVSIPESYSLSKVNNCPNAPKEVVPAKVRVIHCNALGRQFANLTPGSIHEVVNPPQGYKNDRTGVWVMGVGEPVKLTAREYQCI